MFTERQDIAILLINQHVRGFFPSMIPGLLPCVPQVAEKIRPMVDRYQNAFPALLEIPSKDHPYDPSKDSVLKRVQKLFGE
jgi:V-type H+-transporting ATPase subunit F